MKDVDTQHALRSHQSRDLVVVVITRLIPSSIVGVIDVITELLHVADLPSNPASCVLRSILNILDRIVKRILDAILGTIVVLLDVLGDFFDLIDLLYCVSNEVAFSTCLRTHLSSCPFRGVLRKVIHIILKLVLIMVPVLFHFFSLVHQKGTTCQSRSRTHSTVGHAVFLFLVLLFVILAAARQGTALIVARLRIRTALRSLN